MRTDYIGLRVARWRDLGGMTQQQLATEIGVSREYVSMIENGKRAVTKRDLLLRLSRAIGVDANDLTAQPYPPTDRAELALHVIAPKLRRALDGDDEPAEHLPLSRLSANTQTVMAARMACDYDTLGDLLPTLLAASIDLAETSHDQHTRRTGTGLFIKACITGSLTVKPHGFVDLGIRLAELASQAALKLDDPAHTAAAAFTLSQALLAGGSLHKSLALAVRAADNIQPHTDTDAGKEWYGMLHLQSALVLASLNNTDEATSHLAEAEEISASHHGNIWKMEFTPANVGAWRVAVALESNEPQLAAVHARQVDRTALHAIQRRVRLLIDTARGHFLAGQQDTAVRCLLAADDIAPIEVRSRPAVREIVGQMIRDSTRRGGSTELRTLVARLHLDPLTAEET
jgi:transcriptional regulator with XRE-family HTH domain